MQYFVNELFVFEPNKRIFYSHEEIIYQYITGILGDSAFFINEKFHSQLDPKIPEEESKSNESQPKREIELDFKTEFEKIDESTQNPNLLASIDKENYALFLKIVDLKDYIHKYDTKQYVSKLDSAKIFPRSTIATYIYFRNKKYEIESGDLYGFDYMLYEQSVIPEESGFLNKSTHDHSKFAVTINDEDSKKNFKFVDAHRLHRIAHQFNKVTNYDSITL